MKLLENKSEIQEVLLKDQEEKIRSATGGLEKLQK